MRIQSSILGVVLVLSVPILASANQPKDPEGILAALEGFYSAGNIMALENLYTDDYEFLSQQGNEVGAEFELNMKRQLFETNDVTLQFERNFRLKALGEPETWVIPSISVTTTAEGDGRRFSVTNVVTLFLRRNPETGYIQIYRWIEEPTSD